VEAKNDRIAMPLPEFVPPSVFIDNNLNSRRNEEKTIVNGYGINQFQINDIIMNGSVFLFPSHMLLWKPKTMEELTIESLKLLELTSPSTDLLLLGTGTECVQCPPEIEEYLESLGTFVHVMNSRDAASTFQVLNMEGRQLAAAILQMEPDHWTDSDDEGTLPPPPERGEDPELAGSFSEKRQR
jgi:NADH dehydrogenase [ubiquinone] 1 alpha subcomplex assembly factor 3